MNIASRQIFGHCCYFLEHSLRPNIILEPSPGLIDRWKKSSLPIFLPLISSRKVISGQKMAIHLQKLLFIAFCSKCKLKKHKYINILKILNGWHIVCLPKHVLESKIGIS